MAFLIRLEIRYFSRVMTIRWILLMLTFCTACQSGRIPCPVVKSDRMKKNHVNKPLRQFIASLSIDEIENQETTTGQTQKKSKTPDGRTISNVSAEEWDCPRPGTKKYMPKAVKENIRKNLKKVNRESDSLRTIAPVSRSGSR